MPAFRTLLLGLVLPILVHAQSTGILRGQVLDPSGAVVPRASISAAGPNRIVKTTETDNTGSFRILALTPGHYSVRATAPGFTPLESAVDLTEGRISTLEFKLTVALDRQEVTVAEQQQVSADAASNSSAIVVNGTQLDMLSDNPDDLQDDLLALAGPSVGPDGGQIYVDGFSNGQLPPKESIREIRVNSDPFSAQYDRVGYGRIEIFTKPGTDRFHSQTGMVFADSTLNARNPFAPIKPQTEMRQFQTELSGALSKKTSFNVEANHANQDQTALVNAVVLDANFQPAPFVANLPVPNRRTAVSPRIDYALNANNTLQGRYSVNRTSSENNSVGGTNLPSRATTAEQTIQIGQVTETAVIGTRWINEARFQYRRSRSRQTGDNSAPVVQVFDAFAGGAAALKVNFYHSDNWESQNYTSYTRGRHEARFGIRVRNALETSASSTQFNGLYTFNTLSQYAIAQKVLAHGLAQRLTPEQISAQIVAQGGGASQYSITGGNPMAGVVQIDAAPFVQDDWRIKPNFTLSAGLRYEIQNNISDRRAWAPRLGVAWGLGQGRGRANTPKTVLRAGFGLFYDRFSEGATLTAHRANGINQQTVIIAAPAFYPVAPPLAQLLANRNPITTRVVDSHLQSPQTIQSAVGIERQLPRNIALSVTYTNSRGEHQYRARNINAPLPGTYFGPNTGVYPFGFLAGPKLLWESAGLFKQSQLSVTVNARVNARFNVFGNFTHGQAHSNADGLNSYSSEPYNTAGEWGRTNHDIRNQMNFGGSITLPLAIQLNPQIAAQSEMPFSIVLGTDLNGDSLYFDRPAFATDLSRSSVRVTRWGAFDTDPLPGQTIVPKNYGTGFGNLSVNLRVGRTWTFGEAAGSGRSAGKRYSINASLQARNILNTVNPGTPTGTLTSPLFGLATNLQGNQNANRRIEMQVRFGF